MLILKLAYNDDLSFYKDLEELKEELKKKEVLIGFIENIEGSTHILKIMCDEELYSERVKEITNMYVSNILYRIVIDDYKKKEMLEYLTDNYFFLRQSEMIEVEENIVKTLKCTDIKENKDNIYCLNRINSIINKINECISEKQEINIDGFITFRMRRLTKEIEKVIDKTIEMYMVEKEYNEFVRLLKYFVDMQECKADEINIIIDENDKYRIEDENGKSLYNQFLKELTPDEEKCDINIEDLVISGLITISPKNIIIYNKDKCRNKEFLKTIENVFENRVKYNSNINNYLKEKSTDKNIDI